MCCNTKPGPRAALAFFRKKTGIHVTQADWHKIRTCAEVNLGHKLSNRVADSHQAALVAAAFADSLDGTPDEKKALIFDIVNAKTTEGNIAAIKELTDNGLPKEVTEKKPRVSAKQRAELAALQTDNDTAEVPWGQPVEKSKWQKAVIKMVGVSNYTDAVSRLVPDEVVYVEHEPTNAHDPNAMRVYTSRGETIGYLPAEVASRVLQETGESAFTAHITDTTRHDGRTVGGSVTLDQPMQPGEPAERAAHDEWMSENDRYDVDNLPDEAA